MLLDRAVPFFSSLLLITLWPHIPAEICPANATCFDAGIAVSKYHKFDVTAMTEQHQSLAGIRHSKVIFPDCRAEGKIITLPRGGQRFVDMAIYAYSCGAEGVIIYDTQNHNRKGARMAGHSGRLTTFLDEVMGEVLGVGLDLGENYWPNIPVLLVGSEMLPYINETRVRMYRNDLHALVRIDP